MLSRESIVQRLLDQKLISAEEAVVLLKTEVTKWVPNQNQPFMPTYPAQPYQPFTPNQPINVPYCDCHTVSYGTVTGNLNPVTFTSTTTTDLNKNYTDK